MRVFSPRQKTFSDGSIGYLHKLDGSVKVIAPQPKPFKPQLDCMAKLVEWRKKLTLKAMNVLANSLGVSLHSLAALECCPAPYCQTYAFPMRNGYNHVVGIRLRNLAGRKWAETGSHQGMFIPQTEHNGCLYVVEGPTDTAAALTIGLFAVGRPSCSGGVLDLQAFIKQRKFNKVIVVADTDKDKERPDGNTYNPGVDGAIALAEQLPVRNCTLLLPTKDMREFVRNGGNRETVEYLASQVIWRNPA